MLNVMAHEVHELQTRVQKGESLLGPKQEEAKLRGVVEEALPEGHEFRRALDKYRAVLEGNASWSFADKYNVMKGLAGKLSRAAA